MMINILWGILFSLLCLILGFSLGTQEKKELELTIKELENKQLRLEKAIKEPGLAINEIIKNRTKR